MDYTRVILGVILSGLYYAKLIRKIDYRPMVFNAIHGAR